jgi:sugar transferase (PEP-CTERM system associated)
MLEGVVISAVILSAFMLLKFSDGHEIDMVLIFRVILITGICQTCLYYKDLYDFDMVKSVHEIFIRLLQALGMTSIFLAAVYYIFPATVIDQQVYILSILFLIVFIVCWRVGYIHMLNKGIFNEKIIILGSSDLALDIYSQIKNTLDCGYTISILIPDSETDILNKSVSKDILHYGRKEDILTIANDHGIGKVIVALKEKRGAFPMKELLDCRTAGIEVMEGSSFFEMLTGKVLVRRINPSWLVFSEGFRKSKIQNFAKRVEDIVLAGSMLILLFPFLLLVAILIKLDSKGPVFFSQDRVGKDKKEYMMHKFRSMVQDAEKLTGPVWAGENDPRITRVGKVIRKYRIDELPQLWEVLVGKMSLVGPRPERKHFTDKLEEQIPYYGQRFNVKPGLTGWAQVCYDYGATVEDAVEKLNYELFYIKNMSLTLDIVIVLKTIKTVLFGRGAR